MSEGKLGTVLIVDEADIFVAILSDGDLRRALMQKNFSLDDLAITYANQNPKSYSDMELLASDALEIIENDKIQLLPMTNESGHILGVLHIHDLVNAGIQSK
jgi:arabinose-5-phosphate isomerase